MLSVFWAILPSASGGKSSGLMGVSIISAKVSLQAENASSPLACSIIQRTSVLGMDAFTPYMLMWSALYVHQPSASSDKSPVPTTIPPIFPA